MPIQTTNAKVISDAELTRANALETQAAQASVQLANQAVTITNLQATVAARDLTIVQLQALIAAGAPRTAFYVDGGALRTPKGAVFVPRGIECLWGPTSAGNAAAAVAAMKALGANMIAPIFQTGQNTAAHVKACLDAARAVGLTVAVNADANDRAWMMRSDIVAECNAANNVAMLECEVELGDRATMTAAQWRDFAIAFVLDLRNAGHKAPIRVGSPSGGRFPRFALDVGAAVLAADPLKNCLFTLQAYWKASTAGWQYSEDAGFAAGTAGALACADAMKASGLAWMVGLDGADDVGPTPYAELAARLQTHGIGWQWWAMFVGDPYGNGLVADALSAASLKAPFGPAVKALLQAQGVLAVL